MRALVRWSNSSRKNTTFNPRQGEPSRRILRSLPVRMSLEVVVVDDVERGRLDRKLTQLAAGVDHDGGSLGADVALGQQPIAARAGLIDRLHARHFGELLGESLAVRLDLDIVAAAEHLARQLRHGA